MNVTKEVLCKMIPSVAEYADIFYSTPKSDEDMVNNYLPSKLWRLNNLYTIVGKLGDKRIFVMNKAQLKAYSASLKHPRLIFLKSRQQGISTFWLLNFLDDVIFLPNITAGMLAQGLDESELLLGRIKLAWDNFPESIVQFLGLEVVANNSKMFKLSNGSSMLVRTSFRSATLQRLHISEFGKIANADPKKAKEVKTGTLQAINPSNPAVIESTAEGKNMYKSMWDKAEQDEALGDITPMDFKPVFLPWFEDPDCWLEVEKTIPTRIAEYFSTLEAELKIKLKDQQKWFWMAKYDEIGDDVYAEYPATPEEAFRSIREGTYYAKLYRKIIVGRDQLKTGLYEPMLPVYAFFDIGMDDSTFICYVQVYGNSIRFIDEFEDSGEGLEYYSAVLKKSGYAIERVFFPWDGVVKDYTVGMSRIRYMQRFGWKVVQVKRSGVDEGINIVRHNMPNMYIDKKCTKLQDMFLNYSKEFDERSGTFKLKPKHDEFSHAADCVRYVCAQFGNRPKTTKHAVKKDDSEGFTSITSAFNNGGYTV